MAPPQDKAALQRLAALVIRRRSELNLHKADVARAAGMQVNTYSKVEEGDPVRSTTYTRIEPVLGWASGSCLDILAGAAQATLIESTAEKTAVSQVRLEDLAADVGAVVQDAAVSVSDTLTAAEIRELKQRVVDEVLELWEKRGHGPKRSP
jgi:transcriptional regulator with XRE-family HTH domain